MNATRFPRRGRLSKPSTDSSAFYDNYFAVPMSRSPKNADSAGGLPIHFFTIVLNGQPFIQHHAEVFRRLPFPWHWHIVEGVAELNHDTAWSKATGGQIPEKLHRNGLSLDGTTEYLDALQCEFPDRITIYRPPPGKPWDGKLEMVNAPLTGLDSECLLWQIDADELWTDSQIIRARALFLSHPEKTAAHFYCHYFVGPELVITSRGTYGNNSSYEWLRVWRYQPGDRWLSHEPPRLARPLDGGHSMDVGGWNAFSHSETEAMGLVFQHFAYATEAQAAFKECYYGYPGATAQWRQLQDAPDFPRRLADHFSWVTDEAVVDRTKAAGVCSIAPAEWFEAAPEHPPSPLEGVERILFVRTDSVGEAVLASGLIEPIHRRYPAARIAVLCQQHVAELFTASPWVDSIICYDRARMEDASERDQIISEIAAFRPEVILNSERSRDRLSNLLTGAFREAHHIAIESDLANISEADHAESLAGYESLIPVQDSHRTELDYHADFLRGLGISNSHPQPVVWTSVEDEALAEAFFQQHALDPQWTLALWPFTPRDTGNGAAYSAIFAKFTHWNFLILGGAEAEEFCGELAGVLPGKVFNLAGRTTLGEMAALIRRCRILVGADECGPHLASALGVPNVVVVGGGHFGRYIPYSPLTSVVSLPLDCYGCQWECPHDRAHCLADLSPDVVAEAVRQTLARPATKPRVFIQSDADGIPCGPLPRWQRPDKHLCGVDAQIIEMSPIGESIELTPEAKGHVDQAQAALDGGDAAEALARLKSARKLCPRNADLLIGIGNLQFQLGNLHDCYDALESGRELRPEDPLIHVMLATAAVRLDRLDEFENAISRALELDPTFAPAHRLLADLNLESGRYADAAREYGIVAEQHPNDVVVWLALGKCLCEIRQTERAEACFARVLGIDPANEIARQNLSVLRSRPKDVQPVREARVGDHSVPANPGVRSRAR